MKALKNPFLLTGYYGKQYFCNREKELKALKQHFDNERNVVLYSWRRMGKTALIKRFLSDLEKVKTTEAIYVDLLGTRDTASAVRQITQSVYERFGKTSSGFTEKFQKLLGNIGVEVSFDAATGNPTFSLGRKQQQLFARSLNSIGNFFNDRKKPILVILDEFQQVTTYETDDGEALFRSWMQSFPNVRFIFSGSHRTMMTSMFSERNRPFYQSAQMMQLDPISFDPYVKFISQHFTKNHKFIDDAAIEQLYSWCRGQTYCIQLVCNRLYGMYDKVGAELLPVTFNDLLDQESTMFSGFVKLLTITQWEVLVAVAKEEPLKNPLSKEFIGKYQLGAASSVSTALKMLQRKEIVINDEGTFLVHDVLLARWLQTM